MIPPSFPSVVAQLGWLVAGLGAGIGSAAELAPRELRGHVRFSNTNPAILERLGPPGNEGATVLYITVAEFFALPPRVSTAYAVATNLLENDYSVVVSADAGGSFYDVQARITLDANFEDYYSAPVPAVFVVPDVVPLIVDLEECAGLLEIRYLDADGLPVAAGGARGTLVETATGAVRAYIGAQPPGRASNFLVVPAGVDCTLELDVDTGSDIYTDRVTQRFSLPVNVGCDEVGTLDVSLPPATTLGRIIGQVDVLGEFEATVGSAPDFLGLTAVRGLGPRGNSRLDYVAGDNIAAPASGAFELENLLPNEGGETWEVWCELDLRKIPNYSYFISPHLGAGLNPGVTVTAGEVKDLGLVFEMFPAYITGQVRLIGPPDPEVGGDLSGLRAIFPLEQYDADGDGVPEALGYGGIAGPHVGAYGVDTLAPGSTFTAAGGYAAGQWQAAFDGEDLVGMYEIPVAGLNGEASAWQARDVTLMLYSEATNGMPYIYEQFTVSEPGWPQFPLAPGEYATQDLRYGLGEVLIGVSSLGSVFYSPSVRFSQGGLHDVDFEGNLRDYTVYVDPVAGTPVAKADAATSGQILLYLPEGTYDLNVYVTSVSPEGEESVTQLPTIMGLQVVAQTRTTVDTCLQTQLFAPRGTNYSWGDFRAVATSCDGTLTNLTAYIQPLDPPGPEAFRSSIQFTAPGQSTYRFEIGGNLFTTDICGLYRLKAVAKDNQGRVSTAYSLVTFDPVPPEITAPGNLIASAPDAGGAVVDYAVTATDNCTGPVTLRCAPASGTLFPVGTTVVVCEASDNSGNHSVAQFHVTVQAPGEGGCPLAITINPGVPPSLTLTWDCAGALESADDLAGPWIPVLDATSPFATNADAGNKFYRIPGGSSTPPQGLLVYEPFNYLVTDFSAPLAGLDGGLGFAGPWQAGGFNATAQDAWIVPGTLSHSTLAGGGNQMDHRIFSFGSIFGLVRPLAQPLGTVGTTSYLSVVLRTYGIGSPPEISLNWFSGLCLGNLGLDPTQLFLGKPGGGAYDQWVIEDRGGAGQYASGEVIVPAQSALLVVKMEFGDGAPDRFTLYVNPTPGDPEPATGTVKEDRDFGLFDAVAFYANGAFDADELRIGDTFESVTPMRP
jgi:hypothetical protein